MQNWPDFRLRRACTLFQAGLGKAVVLHPTPYQVQTLPPGPPGLGRALRGPHFLGPCGTRKYSLPATPEYFQ